MLLAGVCSHHTILSHVRSELSKTREAREAAMEDNIQDDVEVGFKSLDDNVLGISTMSAAESTLATRMSTHQEFQEHESELPRVDPNSNYGRRSLSIKREATAPVFKEHKNYGTWENLVLAYQTLGVVYGDLGTSPLYVFPTVSINSPQEEDFLGVLSIIFWTLTLMGLLKYIFIVLQADDHGEGGTFALYSKLCRHANIGMTSGQRYSRLESDMELSHYDKPQTLQSKTKRFLETSKVAQNILLLVVMMGTCMVMGDGVLTPAISVLSAIGGIKSEESVISQTVVIIISSVVLVGLFLLQSWGTSKVSFLFSPIMIAWFVSTPMIGAYNIHRYYPGIFKALSPHYIIKYFQRNHKDGWVNLGGIFLCITGAEAMFCDLGHFNKRAIQIAFSTMVYPSLIITYAGEAAYLIKHPENLADAYFKSIPHLVYWPMFIVSTLAAIVASQALISATFSIIKQSMAHGCFPRVKLIHTSKKQEGQVYSPEINYILMVLCLAIVIGFRNGTQIGNAFGVAVVFVMIITTFLVTLVMLVIWSTPWPLILLYFTTYITIEGVYMTSVLNKVPQGGWVPFAISAFFLMVMLIWNSGRQKKYQVEAMHKVSSGELAFQISNTGAKRTPGMCFFYSELLHGVPPIISQYIKIVGSIHHIVVVTKIRFIPVTTVLPSERIYVGRKGIEGIYWCVARYGYMDVIDLEGNEFVDQVIEKLIYYITAIEDPDNNEPLPQQLAADQLAHDQLINRKPTTAKISQLENNSTQKEIAELQHARSKDAVHVVGKVTLISGKNTSWVEGILVDKLYSLLQNTCRSSIAALRIPPALLLQVGMVYEL
ncbi:hypothetical protein O6H91_21G034200 [Diphasiastrum complanatum]|uniref:Uncharacterized protein n=1 Tax=Diphasiastrum complanatum TaxID=34168 RepID=A0ACC2AJM8_DIPCM|nr:hypothetical protein O6H91_21G034200 [Diphasiastrum complanatum]